MILAAGYGTRLWPLTIDRAKPAIPFMNRPLVGYVAEYLAGYGCREIAVNLHHRADSVRSALGDGSRFGVKLHYVEETEILGTSGALDNAREWLEDDTFVVINGKIVTDIDLNQAFETHRRRNALATLVLRPNPQRERFSVVNTHDGHVTGFGGMPTINNADASDNAEEPSGSSQLEKMNASHANAAPLMFTGIQILEPRIFNYIPPKIFSHTTTDVYPQAISRGEVIAAHVADGSWHELSTLERYLETHLAVLKKEGQRIVKGENSIIEANAHVEDAVLWENVLVEDGARVRRAVLGEGVCVRKGEEIEDAIVVRARLVEGEERPTKALRGEVSGGNFVVPLTR
ncbi:MAG: NDP-sugar synthase [Pyrinomonadaceae bacterium]|nr:NDP-sugar synthase [Pyrinomonadaceae bacterium]